LVEWQDNGIILKLSPHGEGKAVVAIFTESHGRHLGYVRGTRKQGAFLQPGSLVSCRWQARLQDNLGSWTIEPQRSMYSRLMGSPPLLAALMSASAWVELTLAEREVHGDLYATFKDCLEQLDTPDGLAKYVHFEISLLQELGFGLDLSQCAASGDTAGLTYVSPKTGRAVCEREGEPYKDRLLPLPRFLVENSEKVPIKDIRDGLQLTSYFLERFVLTQLNKAMPEARIRLSKILRRQTDD
jgi:DNA repair protein RecO (recombination protein O)